MTTEYTDNFRLNLPDFRMGPWHDLINTNTIKIDDLLLNIAQGVDTPPWTNNTFYEAGQTVIDAVDGSFWLCGVSHTSAPVPTTFASDRAAHPTYWNRIVVGVAPRGEWVNSRLYSVNDVVTASGESIIAMCIIAHTSSPAPATIRTDAAYWSFIADLGALHAQDVLYTNVATPTVDNVKEGMDQILSNEVAQNQAIYILDDNIDFTYEIVLDQQEAILGKVDIAGDVMTGMLGLPVTAPLAHQAVRRDYVDTVVANLQPLDATLTSLANLEATGTGLIEQTGATSFAKRNIGVSGNADILSRQHGDGRYITIAGAGEVIDDRVSTLLVAGSNITLTYNDAAGNITIASGAIAGTPPGGTGTQVQYNNAGAFGGIAGSSVSANNSIAFGGATVTASEPILELTQTWNNVAVAFTAFRVNVTSTLSSSASPLMDLQVSSTSMASITRLGRLNLAATGTAIALGTGASGTALGIGSVGGLAVGRQDVGSGAGTPHVEIGRILSGTLSGVVVGSTGAYYFSSTAPGTSGYITADLGLARNAAGILEVNNGTFNTYRDLRARWLIANNFDATNQGLTPLSGGGTANFLRADGTWQVPPGSVVTPAALTRTNDTNVTLTLGGTPATALLQATSITVGWTSTLSAARGGFGADVSAAAGVPLFAAGVPTFTSTTGSGNFVRATSPTLVTPLLGTPTSGVLTTCTGYPYASLTGIPSTFAPSAHGHTAADVSDFAEAVDDRVNGLLVAGTNVTLSYNDASNTMTINSTASGGGGGDVVGPASAVDNRIVLFNSTTGKLVKDSGALVGVTNAADVPTRALGDARWAAVSHSHTSSDITNFSTAVAALVPKITVSSSAPGSPATNDVWIDIT